MKAIKLSAFGAPDVLELAEAADPEVRPADLLVRVYAAGVNRADLTHRKGGYGHPDFGDSPIIGLEIAGQVIAKGAAVEGFEVGDRVMGVVGGGAYAELARIDYRMAMHIPASLDYVRAAAIPEVFVTAHEALLHLARLTSGDSVLIHAAAGGVGSAAVQLAYATGATVYATTDGSKLARVEHLGADVAIDYKTEDFADVIADRTQGRGVDVVIDFIGEPYRGARAGWPTGSGRYPGRRRQGQRSAGAYPLPPSANHRHGDEVPHTIGEARHDPALSRALA